MLKTIRARFTVVYFLLVFIALILISVFILQSFENQNLRSVSTRLDDIRTLMIDEINKISLEDLYSAQQDIQYVIDRHVDIGLREEVFIIDMHRLDIIASSSATLTDTNISQLSGSLVVEGLAGKTAEKEVYLNSQLRVKDKIYPILRSGEQIGMLYLRYDLTEIYDMIHQSRIIIFQAVASTLIVSILISFVISKSITDPIKEITKKARLLASGDFDQIIQVRSDDEIGEFSHTFNYLTHELKRSMTEITNEKRKLETILDNMDDGLVAISDSGEILQANPKAKELLLSVDAKEILALYHEYGDDDAAILLRNGKSLRCNFAPFDDLESQRLGVILVIQDITEEHKLETMRREFVANVSHELKTPLTSIISYAETLQDGALEEREIAQRFLGVIVSEAERMARLVRDLLDLSNFDASKGVLNQTWLEVDSLVKRCCHQLEITAQQRNQTIRLDRVESLSAFLDEDRILQVLNNIITNALKYSPDGAEVTVSVTAEGAEDFFEIVVSDQGSGIPESDLARVFERFYRVDKARSRAMGGTGLGLAIAKEIIEAHGGTIGIESIVECGTTVRIRLPFVVKKK
ncbi:MAG: ATP-binding protein [Bacillota bacterium]|nr:ATP-binding protein [Bacillota bacterium]